jgi:hypothetical protein
MTDLLSFFKTDLIDDHLAAHMNVLIAAALRAEYANTETITATKELADLDCQLQFITASGAARTVELPPEAISNHIHIIYNSGATYDVPIKDDSGTYTFATLAPDEYAICYPLNGESWRVDKILPVTEYKLSVTVAGNNLTVALKHLDGTDPTIYRPIMFVIGGVRRYVSAATSIVLNAGTSWFNAGSARLATMEVDYFLYAVWDSNSSVVAIAQARFPNGTLVSDFSATTTNDRYLGNYANFTATDDVVNIGRFAATLSAGAGFTWTVPTFTGANLIHKPSSGTRLLSAIAAFANVTAGNATYVDYYKIQGSKLSESIEYVFGNTTSLSGDPTLTPIIPPVGTVTNSRIVGLGRARDDSVGTAFAAVIIATASSIVIRVQNIVSTYLAQATPTSTVPMTWTTNDSITEQYEYDI